MTDQPAATDPPQPCAGFPDKCPNPVNVDADLAHQAGGVRCGCNARAELEGMAFTLATGIGGIIDPRTFKATLDRYADQVLLQQPSLRTCLFPGCIRQYDGMVMAGRTPARPEWSGEGWRKVVRGPATGDLCPQHVDIVTAHLPSTVDVPNGRWMAACVCGWISRPQTYGGLLRPLWEEHVLTVTGALAAPPAVTEPSERVPLAEHTEATLTELYDLLDDQDADRAETREAARAMYQGWEWHRQTFGGISRAINAVCNMMRTSADFLDRRDWTVDRTDSYLWAILIGFDDDVLNHVAAKHRWNQHRIKYVRDMRALLAPATDPPQSKEPTE